MSVEMQLEEPSLSSKPDLGVFESEGLGVKATKIELAAFAT